MDEIMEYQGRLYFMPRKEIKRRTEELLEFCDLIKFRKRTVRKLSGGMKRKLMVCRALLTDPEILLLDEPAAGMNPNETEDLREFIIGLNKQGYTIVVIEHDMKFIMRSCNHILVLNFGQKLFEGTPDEVKENRDVQVAYFGKNLAVREIS